MLFANITIVTALWPDWIERIAGFSDGGSGSAEWALVVVFGAVSVIAAVPSRRDHLQWRRPQQSHAEA